MLSVERRFYLMTSWEKLFKLKESLPVQTTEFAVVQGIDHEPAFNWWVKHVLMKRGRIMPVSESNRLEI